MRVNLLELCWYLLCHALMSLVMCFGLDISDELYLDSIISNCLSPMLSNYGT